MSRKLILLFAAILVMSGMAWAQSMSPTMPPGVGVPPGAPGSPGAGAGRYGVHNFSVVPNLSTEALNSAGIFGSDADDFIDPRFYDPGVDLFFLGVNGAVDGASRGRIDVGFGRNFGALYLGVYYGGVFADAEGRRRQGHSQSELPEQNWRLINLQSDVAVLLGFAGMGVRLDARIGSHMTRASTDYSVINTNENRHETRRRLQDGISLALTWGANFGSIAPWVRVGYRFADTFLDQVETNNYGWEGSFSGNAALEASAGMRFTFDDDSFVGAALRFGSTFPDREHYDGTLPINHDWPAEPEFSNQRFGMLGFGVDTYYSRTFDFGMASLGFRPNLGFALTRRSNDWDGGTITWAAPGDQWMTVDGSVNLGFRLQPTERTAIFAGVNLQVFDWTRWSQTDRNDDMYPALESSWRVSGLNVQSPRIGLTFTPAENMSVGLGFTDILNNVFSATFTARLGGGSGAAGNTGTLAAGAAVHQGGIPE